MRTAGETGTSTGDVLSCPSVVCSESPESAVSYKNKQEQQFCSACRRVILSFIATIFSCENRFSRSLYMEWSKFKNLSCAKTKKNNGKKPLVNTFAKFEISKKNITDRSRSRLRYHPHRCHPHRRCRLRLLRPRPLRTAQ